MNAPQQPQIRPEILAFAMLMEQRLRDKDEEKQQSWKDAEESDLLVNITSKTLLLESAVRERFDARVRHAVDLGNYCMMVTDRAGALGGVQ